MVVIPGASHLVRLEYNRARDFEGARLDRLLATFLDAVRRLSIATGDETMEAALGAALGARSFGVPIALL